MPSAPRYTIDLEWVWGPENRHLEGIATVRATVSDPAAGLAAQKTRTWLKRLRRDDETSWISGGWAASIRQQDAVSIVLDLTSGGQDVAESLSDAVEQLQDAVLTGATTIRWEPQPIRL
ncbi:hypothetical protein [Microbacterium sp. YY-01]|uniref:hypothetical protein n=1 Tax=Microbacterium sp. YY-01 TaxID=3421634 RepID=UPI003D183389